MTIANNGPRVHLRVIESDRQMPRHTKQDPITREERLQVEAERPRSYGECIERELGTKDNPCPFAACRHNLLLDVTKHGSIIHNWPGRDFDEIPATCSLRLTEDETFGTLQDVGKVMNLTRERCRQIEEKALLNIKHALATNGVSCDQNDADVVEKVWLARRAR